MRRQHLPLYAIALAVLVIGALAVGVPASSLAIGLLVLACPLMMLFMHAGHGGHDAGESQVPAKSQDDRRSPAGVGRTHVDGQHRQEEE